MAFALNDTIEMSKAIPEVANRIFETKEAAETYIGKAGRGKTAIPGLLIRITNDGDNNGAYWTQAYDDGSLYLVKLFDEKSFEWVEIK